MTAVGYLERGHEIAVAVVGSIGGVVSRATESAAVAAIRSGYVDSRRSKEAVGEIDIVTVVIAVVFVIILSPADEAAPVARILTYKLASESATLKVNTGLINIDDADEAAAGAVAVFIAVDADAADAVLDAVVFASGSNRKAGVFLCRAVDAAFNDEILDRGVVKAIERGTFLVAILFRTAKVERQRMASAVEGATERMVVSAHSLVDGNVVSRQKEMHTSKVVERQTAIEEVDHIIPIGFFRNEIRIVLASVACDVHVI